jgi:hypothetical protein
LGYFGILWDTLGYFGILWDTLGYFGILWGFMVYLSQSKFLINTKGIPREYQGDTLGNTKGIHKAIHIPKAKGIPREYQGNTKGIPNIYD